MHKSLKLVWTWGRTPLVFSQSSVSVEYFVSKWAETARKIMGQEVAAI